MSVDWLVTRAAATPDRTALIFGDERLIFAGLNDRVDEMAAALEVHAVGRGKRVALLGEPSPAWVIAFHALSRLGAVSVPLNTRLGAGDQWALVRAAACFGVITIGAGNTREEANVPHAAIAADAWFAVVDETGAGSSDICSTAGAETERSEAKDDVCTILFTSGTTGRGTAVPLTHGNLWWNAFGSLLNLGSRPNDLWLDCLPLFHVGGLSILVRSVLYGMPVWLQSRFDVGAVSQALDSERVTIVSLVPTMLLRILEFRAGRSFPESLRCILLGGGPIPSLLVERCIEQGIPIAPTYGMTEVASQASTLRPTEVPTHLSSAGTALIGVDIGVERLGAGSSGRLTVAGPSLSPRFSPVLVTGDLGHVDPHGYLQVDGRVADLIVTGGENVSAPEVEFVLRSFPGVHDAGVVGLPDEEWGEIVVAGVVADRAVELGILETFCRERLPGFQRPRQFLFLDELPRTASGKLRRQELGEVLAGALRTAAT